MFSKKSSLGELTSQLKEIARALEKLNAQCAKNPEVQAALQEVTAGASPKVLNSTAFRSLSAAYLELLNAVSSSPFVKMSAAPAVIAAAAEKKG